MSKKTTSLEQSSSEDSALFELSKNESRLMSYSQISYSSYFKALHFQVSSLVLNAQMVKGFTLKINDLHEWMLSKSRMKTRKPKAAIFTHERCYIQCAIGLMILIESNIYHNSNMTSIHMIFYDISQFYMIFFVKPASVHRVVSQNEQRSKLL